MEEQEYEQRDQTMPEGQVPETPTTEDNKWHSEYEPESESPSPRPFIDQVKPYAKSYHQDIQTREAPKEEPKEEPKAEIAGDKPETPIESPQKLVAVAPEKKAKSGGSKKTILAVALLFIVLLAGSNFGTYFWQHQKVNNLNKTNTTLNKNIGSDNTLLQEQYNYEQIAVAGYKSVSNAFMSDLQSNKAPEAYSLTSSLFQSSATEAQLAATFSKAQSGSEAVGTYSIAQEISSAYQNKVFVAVTYEFSGSNKNQAELILEQNLGQWQIDLFEIGPSAVNLQNTLNTFDSTYPKQN